MTDIRIVCAHDGVSTAQALMRLLGAEQHTVELSYGRDALDHLDATRASGAAVVLIWTRDAPTTLYMPQWSTRIDPARLIEIARAPKWPPRAGRRAPVIDFNAWNGLRGGPEWRALTDRLRAIARADEPVRPMQKHAAIALGAFSALAVGGAAWVRADTALHPSPTAPETNNLDDIAMVEADDGLGGPLQSFEPLSIEESDAQIFGPYAPRARRLGEHQTEELTQTQIAPPMRFERPSLIARIASYADPFLGRDDEVN
jgi:hypothetical protein